MKSKKKGSNLIELPSLLSDKSLKSIANNPVQVKEKKQKSIPNFNTNPNLNQPALKTSISVAQLLNTDLVMLRDEIKIRNSSRNIDYKNFSNYKELQTDNITFIKEKISYQETESNSTNVKFPQSFIDQANLNIERHKNFIRKTSKKNLTNQISNLISENIHMNVLTDTVDSIQKVQNSYEYIFI